MPDPISPALPGPDRRTILTGAAWTIPAIVAMSTSPAHAAGSNSPYVTVTTPNQQIIAKGNTTVTATVTTSSGAPAAGQAVSFAAPSGATVSPATATTDSSGIATTTVNLGTPWRTPGSTVTITAVSGGQSTSQPLTVLGANALATGEWSAYPGGSLTFSSSKTLVQIELVFPSPIVQIVSSKLVLLENGTVWTRGDNSYGQLGSGTDGSGTNRTDWGPVPNLTNVIQIASGGGWSNYAVRSDGTLWTWGANGFGQLFQGDTSSSYKRPTQVAGLSGVTQIAARSQTAYALATGAVWACGQNTSGQVGNGQSGNAPVTTPAKVVASGATQIATAFQNCAVLRNDGSVLAWGGSPGFRYGYSPKVLSGLSNATQLAGASYTFFALRSDGSAVSWGNNDNGQEGAGDTVSGNTSSQWTTTRQVVGLTSGAKAVWGSGRDDSSNAGSGYALMEDGSLRSWGSNNAGQLGINTTTSQSSPVTPTLPTGAPAVVSATDTWCGTGAVIVKAD